MDKGVDPYSAKGFSDPRTNLNVAHNDAVDIWMSLLGSCLLLAANLFILWVYYRIFGFRILGDHPEHWEWLGGIVGALAVLIRLACIGLFAFPYTISGVTGLKMEFN